MDLVTPLTDSQIRGLLYQLSDDICEHEVFIDECDECARSLDDPSTPSSSSDHERLDPDYMEQSGQSESDYEEEEEQAHKTFGRCQEPVRLDAGDCSVCEECGNPLAGRDYGQLYVGQGTGVPLVRYIVHYVCSDCNSIFMKRNYAN